MKITGNESNFLILKELGSRIKDMRIKAGITRDDMCELSGLSISSIKRIENGENVKIETILNVMRVLSVLGNLEIIIPEQVMTPSMQLDEGKKRQRAYSAKVKEKAAEWKWGEDK